MRVARWKVMAGGLLLSAGGLMAVADGPPVVPLPGCQPALLPPCLPLPVIPTPATPAVTLVRLEQPIAVPAPSVVELPIPVLALPPLVPQPDTIRMRVQAEPGTTIVGFGAPKPTATNVLIDPKTGHTTTKKAFCKLNNGQIVEVEAGARQSVPLRNPLPADSHGTVYPDPKPIPTPPQMAVAPTLPAITTDFSQSFSPPPSLPAQIASNMNATPAAPPTLPLAVEPAAPPVPSSPFRAEPFVNAINSTPAEPATPAPAVPVEKPAPEPRKPDATPSAAERRLKVVLHMGDDRPRFEVRDGDEIYLKVVSDRVEVKSAADKADAATMKAGGKVGFVTPGGDGTCDELTILPGSGQVVAVGNVAFRHTWGRSETTVTAERMTFRLAHPGPTAIQAGYTPVR